MFLVGVVELLDANLAPVVSRLQLHRLINTRILNIASRLASTTALPIPA